MTTPYEKLKSLPNAKTYLKKGLTFEELDSFANKMSDNEAAKKLNYEREKLFKLIFEQSKKMA